MYDQTRLIIRSIAAGLQGCTAIALLVIVFYCQVHKTYRATTVSVPNATLGSLRSAVYWDTDVELPTRYWNPYLVLFTLQWITVGFSIFYVQEQNLGLRLGALSWDALGLVFFTSWAFYRPYPGTGSAMMIFVCAISFLVAMAVITFFDAYATGVYSRLLASPARCAKKTVEVVCVNGRYWNTPIGRLRAGPLKVSTIRGDAEDLVADDQVMLGMLDGFLIVVRYLEYAITSPLLLLAIFCLLVVDGPQWMYASCYWFMVACNVFGALLQYGAILGESMSLGEVAAGMVGLGNWKRSSSAIFMNLAWICLLMAVVPVIYLCMTTMKDAPFLVLAIIW